jgi:glycosyltransferase involved in cell wall biosynthesis
MSNPLVTVYISSYNHEKYIRECIESIINQTYPNLEIVIQDDCSTDSSREIIAEYPQIKMLPRDKHLGIDGIYPSLNDAIYSANGKYFYKIDSDDFIENNYIEKLVNEAESGDYDWVCGNLKIVNHESRVGELWDYSTWDVSQNGSLLRGWDRGSVLLPHNGIFRVKFLTDNKLMWQSFD